MSEIPAPPPAETAERPYYRARISALRLREFLRMAGGGIPALFATPAFLVSKLLRWPWHAPMAVRPSERLQPPSTEDPPPAVLRSLDKLVAEAEDAGLGFQFYYQADCVGPQESMAAVMTADEGRSVSLHVAAVNSLGVTNTVTSIWSRRHDGAWICTALEQAGFDPPPDLDLETHANWSVAQLLERHRQRLAELSGVELRAHSGPRLNQAVLEIERESIERLVKRGVYEPVPPAALAKLRRVQEKWSPPQTVQTQTALGRRLLIWLMIFIITLLLWQTFGM